MTDDSKAVKAPQVPWWIVHVYDGSPTFCDLSYRVVVQAHSIEDLKTRWPEIKPPTNDPRCATILDYDNGEVCACIGSRTGPWKTPAHTSADDRGCSKAYYTPAGDPTTHQRAFCRRSNALLPGYRHEVDPNDPSAVSHESWIRLAFNGSSSRYLEIPLCPE